jgi:hypothetical protein
MAEEEFDRVFDEEDLPDESARPGVPGEHDRYYKL